MTKQDITEAVTEAVQAALKAERDEFWVPQPQHFLDHEMLRECREQRDKWAKNHEWVSGVRREFEQGGKWTKKAAIMLITVAFLGFIGAAAWSAVIGAVKKALGL